MPAEKRDRVRPEKTLISPDTLGVDQKKNPLFLGGRFVAHGANVMFEEGVMKTRHGFNYRDTKVSGQFQGFTRFQPARGLSFTPFAPSIDSIAFAADERIWIYENGLQCANEICNPVATPGIVHLFQAENYLISQSVNGDTSWYEGGICMVRSPGVGAPPEIVSSCACEVDATEKELVGGKQYCCYDRITYTQFDPVPKAERAEHSHDSFVWSNHQNFLINGAGIGVYAHGRIHQEGPHSIYVSDIIHGRGNKVTDDILLMEEQVVASFGSPLSTNSDKGNLVAMAVLPEQGAANGEGELIAYYEHGVVSFNTFQFPRQTRHDGSGELIQEGWGTKRMVGQILNSISAVGRYAVTVLPRDHFFRSKQGLHFLKTSMGQGVFNDELTNVISAPVGPVLGCDPVGMLSGSATGHWGAGSRLFASVGMYANAAYSADTIAQGFVSWNQASTYTEDRTPIPVWEGVMIPDYEIAGVFAFSGLGDSYGFLCSTKDSKIHFAEIVEGQEYDYRDGEEIPIEWEVVTSAMVLTGLNTVATVSEGIIEAEMAPGSKIVVEVRSDRDPEWARWKEVSCDKGRSLVSKSLGLPPEKHRNATWVQIRLTGVGYSEVSLLSVNHGEGLKKGDGRGGCYPASNSGIDFFRLAEHTTTRWAQ